MVSLQLSVNWILYAIDPEVSLLLTRSLCMRCTWLFCLCSNSIKTVDATKSQFHLYSVQSLPSETGSNSWNNYRLRSSEWPVHIVHRTMVHILPITIQVFSIDSISYLIHCTLHRLNSEWNQSCTWGTSIFLIFYSNWENVYISHLKIHDACNYKCCHEWISNWYNVSNRRKIHIYYSNVQNIFD